MTTLAQFITKHEQRITNLLAERESIWADLDILSATSLRSDERDAAYDELIRVNNELRAWGHIEPQRNWYADCRMHILGQLA